uniref:Death-associated protein kinase related n=4 Tax=Cacopsylla melanoneura TaxID=428564 RepID=A0A8D8TRU0_9HEMI
MWSVGVLMYVLLTGCSPFGGDTKQETFCNIAQCKLEFPDELFEDISEPAQDLMRRLMVKKPSNRLNAKQCLEHVWFSTPSPAPSIPDPNPAKVNSSDVIQTDTCESETESNGVVMSNGGSECNGTPECNGVAKSNGVGECNGAEDKENLEQTQEQSSESDTTKSEDQISETSPALRAISSPLAERKANGLDSPNASVHNASVEDLSPIKTPTNNRKFNDGDSNNNVDSSKTPTPTTPMPAANKDNSPKGMNGERRRSFMKNMEDLVKKLEELDTDTTRKNKDDKEENSSNLRRATSMQTMPVPNLVRYKLDSKFSKNVVHIDDDPLFKYKRLFIFDDVSDTSSPPSSNYGSMSSDNSSMSDSASEMSLDSSSDRSSIISLDDTLDVMYSKNHRHYSSCYNVWEAVRNKNNTRLWPRECDGSFERAVSRFTTSPPDSAKEGFHPLRNKNSLTIFNPAASGRKCIGLELMKERNGNIVVIREIKAINGSKYPRCSEVKCESVQSRIRRLQIQNGLRTELDKSSQDNDIF